MPRRQSIVTLEPQDEDILRKSLVKKPQDDLVSALRKSLNENLAVSVPRLLTNADRITQEMAEKALTTLELRRQRFLAVPVALITQVALDEVLAPIDDAIALCHELLAEFGGHACASTA